MFLNLLLELALAGNENQALAHSLRIWAGLTTSRSSTFAITWNIQQLGVEFTVNADREHILIL